MTTRRKVVERPGTLQGLNGESFNITIRHVEYPEVRCSTCEEYKTPMSQEPCKSCINYGDWH